MPGRPKNKDRKVIRNRNLSFIQMLGEDKELQEIADKFGLSKRTVERAIDELRIEYGCNTVGGLKRAIDELRIEYGCNTVGGLIYKLFKLGLIK